MLASRPLVHVLDDDDGVLRVVRELLERSGYEVASYLDPRSFLTTYRPRHPQCLLADVFLPMMSGLELQRRLQALDPDLPVVMVTGNATAPMVIQALRQGVLDFLEKPWRSEELLDAVGRAIEEDRRRQARRQELAQADERLAMLTAREREVFDLVVAGLSSKEAAARMCLSKRTVDFHRANVMHKLGVESVTDLVRLAVASQGAGADGPSRPPETGTH